MERREINTPGPAGYLLALLISIPAMPALAVVYGWIWAAVDDTTAAGEPAIDLIVMWPYASLVVSFVAVPLALVGIPLVHLLSARTRPQVVHVVMTGAVTFAEVCLLFGGPGDELARTLAVFAAAATMVGRAAVIPMVLARRARAKVRPAASFSAAGRPA